MLTNNVFANRLNLIPSTLWTKIAQIDELKGQWSAGIKLDRQVLTRLRRSVLVTSTGASTRIEGAQLSDADIEKLMRGLAVQKFTDRDKQEVQGYYELLENVFEAWPTIPLSESIIKYFHKELLKYTDKDLLHRGEYKKVENQVVMIDQVGQSVGTLFDTTPAYLTPKQMSELVDWTSDQLTQASLHPLLLIAHFVVEFLNIHPFQDGNGRLSRILTNLLLLKSGYLYAPYVSHEKFIEDNKPDYYLALRRTQKTFQTPNEDLTPWLSFFLQVLLQQAQQAVTLLTDQHIEALLSPLQVKVWHYLQQVTQATPQQITQHTLVARPTVNQVLTKLLRLNKIERLGLGRASRYRIL